MKILFLASAGQDAFWIGEYPKNFKIKINLTKIKIE